MGQQILGQFDIAFFIPAAIKGRKRLVFEQLAQRCKLVIRSDVSQLTKLPPELVPMVGCTFELRHIIKTWLREQRKFLYWDRGYWARQGFSAFPRAYGDTSRFRVHINSFQMQTIRAVPSDRYEACPPPVRGWRIGGGRHIVVAAPSVPYALLHGLKDWPARTVAILKHYTDRPIVVRHKGQSSKSLYAELTGAHALVTHGSIAAVEAVILGVPVFVDQSSAAALVGLTDLSKIEKPIMPDRTAWLHSLAYSQFTEYELINGKAFELLEC